MVDKDDIVIDIGSDHALLPIYLIKNEISKLSYAIDNKIGPLNRAIKNIKEYDVQDSVIPILSDGFNNLSNIEYDTVTISGMGGDLIKEILDNPIYKKNKKLILEGNKAQNRIREFLMNNNYKIIDERIVYENNIYYFIIKAIPSKNIILLNKYEIEYGPINIKNKNPLLKDFLNLNLSMYENALKNSMNNENIISKIDFIKEVLNEIS